MFPLLFFLRRNVLEVIKTIRKQVHESLFYSRIGSLEEENISKSLQEIQYKVVSGEEEAKKSQSILLFSGVTQIVCKQCLSNKTWREDSRVCFSFL